MRAKTGKRDRTSRRASLRKIAASVTPRRIGAKIRTASHKARSTAGRTRGAARKYALAPRNVVVGTLCVVAAAALLMGRPSVKTFEVVDEAGNVIERLEPLANGASVDPAALAGEAVALPRASDRSSASPASVVAPKTSEPAQAPAAFEPASRPAVSPDTTMKLISAPAPVASQSASTAATPAADAEEPATPVTLAGCVERNDDGFWLKNASGDGAPKSRSWKSGFLRRKSLTVELVDRGYTHRLATYVGQRVETNGVLVDREMRVKSLRVLGSCD